MKKAILLITVVALSVSAFSQQNKHHVSAHISGIGSDTVFALYYYLSNMNEVHNDTLFSTNDQFKFSLPQQQPAVVALIPYKSFYKRVSGRKYAPNTKFLQLLVQPYEQIEIRGSLEKDYLEYKIKGSSFNELAASMRAKYKEADIAAVHFELQSDTAIATADKQEYFRKRVTQNQVVARTKLNYVKEHVDNELSAYYLIQQSLDTFAAFYPKLKEKIRNGIFEAPLKSQYERYQKFVATSKSEKTTTTGKQAPDFSLRKANGETFTLSDLKGKYVVLDFWGTWCGWCLKEFPSLSTYYTKYKEKIEFVGIACDDKETDWKKAIHNYQLNWIQVINTAKNDVAVLYGIQAFPTKIILDKDLKVIARFVGADENFYKKLDDLK